MSPEKSSKTASKWRRTRHFAEALSLIQFLDGERTVAAAAKLAGMNRTTAWRLMATIRCLAVERRDLLELEERQVGKRVYYTVTLLSGAPGR